MNQWHYNKIKQLKDWERDLRAVLVFNKNIDEETKREMSKQMELLAYAKEQAERVQELEEENKRIRQMKYHEAYEQGKFDTDMKIWHEIPKLEQQNKRYRDMLVKIFKIVQNHQIMKISDEDYADAATILYKWIYDTGAIDHEKHFSELHGHDEFDSHQINLLLKKHIDKESSKTLEGEE